MRWIPALLALGVGCTIPKHVTDTLAKAENTVALAEKVYARKCAPVELATGKANLDFARVELKQGYVRRADEHADAAYRASVAALEIATPCGGADRDQDTVADIVDRCPDEKEDLDGFQDEDGCRDLDPMGDEDADGVVNIDDGCIDVPEDLDGDRDDDGCPETSEDRDGDGLIDAVDACPDEAEDVDGFRDSDGCPDPDNDEDGVIDIRDACALDAEDLDGWQDDDGCPEADNDEDGISDASDRCPNEPGPRANDGCPVKDADGDGIADINDLCPTVPEVVNNYLDEDGCPDAPPTNVTVTRTRVEIKETIQFETGSATLLPSSNRVLDDVAQVLNDVGTMRLRIEGHTDAEGSDETNLDLSRERATSVRVYLESKGIPRDRLESVGKGETEPIDTNRTPSGRARNRRVEFHIIE